MKIFSLRSLSALFYLMLKVETDFIEASSICSLDDVSLGLWVTVWWACTLRGLPKDFIVLPSQTMMGFFTVWKTNTFCWYFHFVFGPCVLLVYLLKHGLCCYKTCSALILSLIVCSNEADKNLCTIWLHKFLFHVLSRSQYSIPFCSLR